MLPEWEELFDMLPIAVEPDLQRIGLVINLETDSSGFELIKQRLIDVSQIICINEDGRRIIVRIKIGFNDLVFGIHSDQAIHVFLGDGTGDFVPPATSRFAVGGEINTLNDIAVAELTGDANLDVAVPNSGFFDSAVDILPGDGAGGFGAPMSFPVELGPKGIAVGDLNGDGHFDLVTANAMDLTVLLGDGAGSYTPAPRSPFAVGLPPSPTDVVLADMNGDGLLDVVVSAFESGSIAVLLNNPPF